jgi:hypothetical protein
MRNVVWGLMLAFGAVSAGAISALAAEPVTVELALRGHRFVPDELRVPSGRPILLRITNHDAEAEEFESSALKVEKVISGGQSFTLRLRPLAPGRFAFVGEYHAATAKGVIIAEKGSE